VPLRRQVYLGLNDGALTSEQSVLDDTLADIIESFKPDRIFTTGFEGYDGHADHIAMHKSALRALKERNVHRIVCYALDAQHRGEYVIPNSRLKLGAIAMHISQRISNDLTRWGESELYTPLITGSETYSSVV
jgi:LmbE family N-acetylglucosaminyl deacetylase